MFQILEIAEIKVEKKTAILSILIDISVVIIQRMQQGNKSLGLLENAI